MQDMSCPQDDHHLVGTLSQNTGRATHFIGNNSTKQTSSKENLGQLFLKPPISFHNHEPYSMTSSMIFELEHL